MKYQNKRADFEMKMPGNHNVLNMSVALGIGNLLEIESEKIYSGVKTFRGIKRRFEIHEGEDGIIYIDDYAHHPTELRAAINAARTLWPGKKMTVIFQPHLYSRTKDFMDDFGEELSKVDELLLMEIYPARELPLEGITSSALLKKISSDNKKIIQKKDLMATLDKNKIEVLMTLGAGDIDVFAPKIREWIDKND